MTRVPVLVLLLLLLAGCGEQGTVGGLLVLEGRHTIGSGEAVAGDLFVLDGEVDVRADGRVAGSVFVLGGTVRIAGEVGGDVAVVGGDVRLTETSVVVGGLRRGGGNVERAAGASVGTELVSPVSVDALLAITRPNPESAGPGPWLLVQLLVLAVLAALAERLGRRGLARMTDAIRAQPLVPLAVGILAVIVGLSLTVFMVFTVVLIPVAMLLGLAAIVGAWLGFVGLGQLAADAVLRTGAATGRSTVRAAIGSVGLAVAVSLLSALPVVGEIVVAGVAATALGAWLVTRLGTRRLTVEA